MQKWASQNWLTGGVHSSSWWAIVCCQKACCSHTARLFHLQFFTHEITASSTQALKCKDYFVSILNLLLVWYKIPVCGVCDHIFNTPAWNPDWWSMVTCCGDVGTSRIYTSRGGKYPHQNEPIQPGVQQVWDCQLLPQNPLWAQARLLKEKTKCFVGFWHRRSLLQRSAILHYSAGWEDSAWCWQGPLSDTSRSHAVGSLLSWQEGSTANWTIVGDVVNWFCSGFTGVVPNCKAPVQVFP